MIFEANDNLIKKLASIVLENERAVLLNRQSLITEFISV